tara:strand:- start:83 stop:943 length:861 start_codon:yes stop_codon:yes gene_type:complete
MNYSESNFFDALILLEGLNEFNYYKIKNVINSQQYSSNNMNDVINLCMEARLTTMQADEKIVLTSFSKNLLKKEDTNEKYILILENLLRHSNPPWLYDITKGIETAKLNMPDNFVKIFDTFHLFNQKRREVIVWWNNMKQLRRSRDEFKLSKIGLEGEFAIIDFEFKRIGKMPEHCSINDDSLGYDILSFKSKEDETKIMIEVKNSTSETLRFFITKNEFNKCENFKDKYLIYLIDSSTDKDLILYIFNWEVLNNHIPKNKGLGQWTSIEIKPNSKFLNECKKYKL